MVGIRASREVGGLIVRITADCVGSGQCTIVASNAFSLDSDGMSTFSDPSPGESAIESVRMAALACPTGAIEIEAP